MGYSRIGNTTFTQFDPPLSLQDFIALRHARWRDELDDNVIFNTWRFANIWRELDRTTCYMINEVLPRHEVGSAKQMLEVCAFRTLGKIETDQAITAKFSTWVDALDAGYDAVYDALPPKPATGAYARMVGIKRSLMAPWIIRNWFCDTRSARLVRIGAYAAARDLIAQDTYLGRFVATQVIYDLTWLGGELESDWTTFGVGAAHGLSLHLGRNFLHRRHGNFEVEDEFVALVDLDALAASIVVMIPPLVNGQVARFGRRELEQSLCEYSRYCRIWKYGKPGPQRLYERGEPFVLARGWQR